MATLLGLSNAMVARLKLRPEFVTYDAVVPTTPASAYAVAYPSSGSTSADTYSQKATLLRWPCYVICVGRSRQQCLNTADLVRNHLEGWRIDPSPAAAPLSELNLSTQIVRDETEADIRFSLTLLFVAYTTRD